MTIVRSTMLAIAVTLGASGCRAWNPGTLTPTPRPLAERTLDVDEFVAEHNRNADRIQTLEAQAFFRAWLFLDRPIIAHLVQNYAIA